MLHIILVIGAAPRGPFQRLAKKHEDLARVPCVGELVDVGIPDRLARVQQVVWRLEAAAAVVTLEPVSLTQDENLAGWIDDFRDRGWSSVKD